MRILLAILVIVAGAMVYFRLAPVKFTRVEMPAALGDYPTAGGFTAVRALTERVTLDAVTAAMLALPRTTQVADAPLTFITRSRGFGFPDVTVLEVRDGTLAVSGHLVYGKSDLGVNQKRILQVLASL